MIKKGDKIFVFDGSNYGKRNVWIDIGVYTVQSTYYHSSRKIDTVDVNSTKHYSSGESTLNFDFTLPINQVVALGQNRLIEILFDTKSYNIA